MTRIIYNHDLYRNFSSIKKEGGELEIVRISFIYNLVFKKFP